MWCVRGVTFTHPTQVFQEASNSLDDFRRLSVRELDLRSRINEEAPIFWKKPPIGLIKVNWGLVVDKTYERIRISIIVRNNEGVVLAARSTPKKVLVEPVICS